MAAARARATFPLAPAGKDTITIEIIQKQYATNWEPIMLSFPSDGCTNDASSRNTVAEWCRAKFDPASIRLTHASYFNGAQT